MSPQEQDSPNENAEFIAENQWQVKIMFLFKIFFKMKNITSNNNSRYDNVIFTRKNTLIVQA